MEGEPKAFLKVWSTILASLCYCYFIASAITKGKLRFFSLLPIFSLYTLLPLSLSSTLPSGITAFFITWLANFKLILFSFDLGPLSEIRSFPKFILFAVFPIKIKDPFALIGNPTKVLPLNFWSETLIFSILVAICDLYKGKLHQGVVLGIYCCMLYLFIDVVLGVCSKLVGSVIGVELVPPSDEPYAATSLQDFWGRRWNLMVTDIMRHTVYKPSRVFLSKHLGWGWKATAIPAVMAAFVVSGLMHELIFYYMIRVRPTWEVTCFFLLHGLCVVVEVALKGSLGRRLRLHWAVTGPLAVGFVIGTGYWLFFPPLLRNQADVKAIEETKALYEIVKHMFRWQT